MKFKSVIIFLNNICTVGCRTCNVSAVPGNRGVLDAGKLIILLTEVKKKSNLKYIIWTGGEPFLTKDILISGLKQGNEFGFTSEILTSGIWFRDNPGFTDLLKEFSDISIRISLDAEHNVKVDHELIMELISRALDNGVDVNFTLRVIPSAKYDPYALFKGIEKRFPDYYSVKKSDSRWIHKIPHIPVKENDPYLKAGYFGVRGNSGCSYVYRDLVAGWDGNIYPCCGLFSLNDFKLFSTIKIEKDFFNELNKKITTDETFRKIKNWGKGLSCLECNKYLAEIARRDRNGRSQI